MATTTRLSCDREKEQDTGSIIHAVRKKGG